MTHKYCPNRCNHRAYVFIESQHVDRYDGGEQINCKEINRSVTGCIDPVWMFSVNAGFPNLADYSGKSPARQVRMNHLFFAPEPRQPDPRLVDYDTVLAGMR